VLDAARKPATAETPGSTCDVSKRHNAMRSGEMYVDSVRDGREIYIHGRKVASCEDDEELAKSLRLRADIYDILRDDRVLEKTGVYNDVLGCTVSRLHTPPVRKQDWYDKLEILDIMFRGLRYLPCRVGDETIPAMWSMMDGADFIAEKNRDFAKNIRAHLKLILANDPYHVSGNADPKSNRSAQRSRGDMDMLLHAVGETAGGVIVRGAKYETGAAYANQAFIKPTVGDWSNKELAPYAIGFIVDDFAQDNIKIICRDANSNVDSADYPLSGKADEIESMVIFDDVLIPWDNVLFYNDVATAAFVRGTLHRYSVFMFMARLYYFAKLYLGVAYLSMEQCGLHTMPQVREKLAELVCYEEMAHAFLVASIETGACSPSGYWMPNQGMMLSGRYLLCSQLVNVMQACRELCGGQPPCTAGSRTFFMEDVRAASMKYYRLSEQWTDERRHRLIALSNDLLNSRYANSRLNFYMFAHSPPFAQKSAVMSHHEFNDAVELVKLFANMA
jgi:4-hydroxyphenylacetate 3-monooxygenase